MGKVVSYFGVMFWQRIKKDNCNISFILLCGDLLSYITLSLFVRKLGYALNAVVKVEPHLEIQYLWDDL